LNDGADASLPYEPQNAEVLAGLPIGASPGCHFKAERGAEMCVRPTAWAPSVNRDLSLPATSQRTHPIKEDVKKKVLSSPLAGGVDVWLASSRVSLLEGLLIFPLWLAAISGGEANPSCLSQLTGFMKRWRSTPFGSRGYASY